MQYRLGDRCRKPTVYGPSLPTEACNSFTALVKVSSFDSTSSTQVPSGVIYTKQRHKRQWILSPNQFQITLPCVTTYRISKRIQNKTAIGIAKNLMGRVLVRLITAIEHISYQRRHIHRRTWSRSPLMANHQRLIVPDHFQKVHETA